jgi:hypothetical protein
VYTGAFGREVFTEHRQTILIYVENFSPGSTGEAGEFLVGARDGWNSGTLVQWIWKAAQSRWDMQHPGALESVPDDSADLAAGPQLIAFLTDGAAFTVWRNGRVIGSAGDPGFNPAASSDRPVTLLGNKNGATWSAPFPGDLHYIAVSARLWSEQDLSALWAAPFAPFRRRSLLIPVSGGGSTAVGTTTDLRWNLAALTGRAADLRWQVRELTANRLDSRWQIRALIGDRIDLRWDAVSSLATVGRALDMRWGVAELVGRTLDARWELLEALGVTADLRWDIRTQLAQALDVQWGLRELVGERAELRWDSLELVGDTVTVEWTVVSDAIPVVQRVMVVLKHDRVVAVRAADRILVVR